MVGLRISELGGLADLAAADQVPVLDVSDTSMAGTGDRKSVV